jgi:quinoprotein glucose dehydrogenase
MLYVKTSNTVAIAQVAKPDSPEVDADYSMTRGSNAVFHNGLPLLKPPYGHLTAVNLNAGEIAWQEPFGDMPRLRNHPALEGVKLPAKFGVAGAQGVIVTKGGIIFAGSGDTSFHAVDKTNGHDLWTYPLGRQATGTPMTYLSGSGRQFVIIATGTGREGAVLMAFALE